MFPGQKSSFPLPKSVRPQVRLQLTTGSSGRGVGDRTNELPEPPLPKR